MIHLNPLLELGLKGISESFSFIIRMNLCAYQLKDREPVSSPQTPHIFKFLRVYSDKDHLMIKVVVLFKVVSFHFRATLPLVSVYHLILVFSFMLFSLSLSLPKSVSILFKGKSSLNTRGWFSWWHTHRPRIIPCFPSLRQIIFLASRCKLGDNSFWHTQWDTLSSFGVLK